MTTAEAARVAGVSARTIRRWIEKGTLPAVAGAGGVLYVFPHDLEAARVASGSRPSPVARDTRDAPDGSRGGDDPGVRDATGTSALSPDPAGEAAGAVLMAWRDTVLGPVVGELAAVRRELGDARERVGRLEAERDQAARERDALRDEVERLRVPAPAPEEEDDDRRPATEALMLRWRRWFRRVTGGP
ncbi:MAG: helix-turn-helix domain-containing protein [Chloroflexota bacterium]|nr:helix-turn-helix domain-containing protein [Chloroflexota bacterium]